MPGLQSQQSICWVLWNSVGPQPCGHGQSLAVPDDTWVTLLTLIFTSSSKQFKKLFCESRPKRQLQSIYTPLGEHSTPFSMSSSAFLQSPPSHSHVQGSLSPAPPAPKWVLGNGFQEMVSLLQMKTWCTGCFLQTSSLLLIIALTFTCLLLLFSHLFPNTSLVTRREQKQRRWFIQTKLGVDLCSVLHFFLKQSRGNCQQSLLNQSIPSLPSQCYPHFSASHESHCKEGGDFSEPKESPWLGCIEGGKLNSLLLTASSLNLCCLLISCIPVEKSRLKTQVVKTSLVFSTNAGGSMAVLSQSGVERALRKSLFPI